MSVKVGVRVRPFNKRQQQLGSRLCVQMDGTTTSLVDGDGQKKSFNYDYSFWSHDGFRNGQDGYSHPIDDRYADQKRVYELIGSSILTNAWQGYNCCLFAYGQTGSGKSYSMIGYGANKGLIPIVCNSIFEKIHGNQDGTRSFEVKISMLEIYNEAVRDLLSKSKKTELKICQHKTLGVYVEGLQKHGVDSYEKIQKKIEEGSNNRSMASTLMNESSSRSHTIVSINFVQKIQISMEQTSVKYSVIHLVDLAGSQCVAKTGADSKDRLRETAKINQSLTTLGRVIQILAENCNKKEKDKTFVPYRDSKLTFILRNALGGNSCTAMICAISPSDDNFEQSLSTLRYASRAKKIQNRAIVNESDVDKLIRVLRQQNQMLKQMLKQAKTNKTAVNEQMISNFNQTRKMVDLAVQAKNGVNNKSKSQQQEILQNLNEDSFFNNSQESNSVTNDSFSLIPFENTINQDLPYLTNISEDQLLSYRIKYSCQKLLIGNKKGNPKPDVILTSLGIQQNHAYISYDTQQKKCYIQLLQQNAVNFTFVNGQTINAKTKQEIFHLDRIIFGTGCLFILIFKGSTPRSQMLKSDDIDYQFAMSELQISNVEKGQNQSNIVDQKKIMLEEQQLRKKIVSQIQQDYLITKKQKQQQLKRQIQQRQMQYNIKIKELQQVKQRQAGRLLLQLQLRKQQTLRLEQEKSKIKEQVQKILEESKQRQMREQSEKKRMEQTKQELLIKQIQIQQLQRKMLEINIKSDEKTQNVKQQIKKQQQDMKKQLQIQTIICHNANIIAEYQLQLNKRLKNAKEVKDLLVKKEKIQLQKQLVELVPQVERFNLMAKQMNKKVQCGLSIQYKYISEAEIIQVIQNKSYKSKLKILIHVINRDEGRSYYWDLKIFNNRFEHALEYFDNYIKIGKTLKYQKQQDPYWDPEQFETVAHTHLTLQSLMFNISFSGDIAIISHSKKIGKVRVNLYQTDFNGVNNICIDGKGENSQYKLVNPHEQIERTIHYVIQLDRIELIEGEIHEFDKMKLEYHLLENYKTVKYQTDIILRPFIQSFKYRKVHIIKDLSENIIIHYLENPLAIQIQIVQRVQSVDELTHRSSFSTNSNIKSSFSIQMCQQEELKSQSMIQNLQITQFQQVSPPKKLIKSFTPPAQQVYSPTRSQTSGVIFQNTQITKKVQDQYQRKKRQQTMTFQNDQINMKKKKEGSAVTESSKKSSKNQKQCQIY